MQGRTNAEDIVFSEKRVRDLFQIKALGERSYVRQYASVSTIYLVSDDFYLETPPTFYTVTNPRLLISDR